VVPRLSGTPGALKFAAPAIGEHNEVFLRPLMGEAEYARLCRSGVISKGRKK
jgi:formyl-CoA transferase